MTSVTSTTRVAVRAVTSGIVGVNSLHTEAWKIVSILTRCLGDFDGEAHAIIDVQATRLVGAVIVVDEDVPSFAAGCSTWSGLWGRRFGPSQRTRSSRARALGLPAHPLRRDPNRRLNPRNRPRHLGPIRRAHCGRCGPGRVLPVITALGLPRNARPEPVSSSVSWPTSWGRYARGYRPPRALLP